MAAPPTGGAAAGLAPSASLLFIFIAGIDVFIGVVTGDDDALEEVVLDVLFELSLPQPAAIATNKSKIRRAEIFRIDLASN